MIDWLLCITLLDTIKNICRIFNTILFLIFLDDLHYSYYQFLKSGEDINQYTAYYVPHVKTAVSIDHHEADLTQRKPAGDLEGPEYHGVTS